MEKTLQEKARAHGDASEYHKQAQAFMDGTGTVIEARYLGLQEKWNDKEPRDVYEVRIKRGKREYVTEYGDSIVNTEKRIASLLGKQYDHYAGRVRKGDTITGLFNSFMDVTRSKKAFATWQAEASEWGATGMNNRPSAYDVLACLQAYEPAGDVDEFAGEYGYTKPSEALRVFGNVVKEWTSLLTLYSNEEMEALQEIG